MPIGSDAVGNLPSTHLSPDKTLILQFTLQLPNSRYQLVDAASGRTLATAESAIVPNDVDNGICRDGLEVLFAAQDSSVIVREDVGDASPAVRFIDFERQSDGSYITYYLLPPFDLWHNEWEGADFPHFLAIDKKKAILYYDHRRRKKVLKLAAISKTKNPETELP